MPQAAQSKYFLLSQLPVHRYRVKERGFVSSSRPQRDHRPKDEVCLQRRLGRQVGPLGPDDNSGHPTVLVDIDPPKDS